MSSPPLTSNAALIALDWGTSSLRAFLFNRAGGVIGFREGPLGIMQVRDGDFAGAFAELCADWVIASPSLPLLASGMIGSPQGLRQVSYVDGPASLDALARGIEAAPLAGTTLHIVPGVAIRGERPDVMRGEETQVFGALALRPECEAHALFVMPGTHCKWVTVREGRIHSFQTFMTGEVFAVMRRHSILGRFEPSRNPSEAAFLRGVEAARRSEGGVAPLLFSARSLVLTGALESGDSLEYLSGLLIGDEVRCAIAGAPDRLGLIGDTALCQRYARAIAAIGRAQAEEIEGATQAGLWRIAVASGLVPAAP